MIILDNFSSDETPHIIKNLINDDVDTFLWPLQRALEGASASDGH